MIRHAATWKKVQIPKLCTFFLLWLIKWVGCWHVSDLIPLASCIRLNNVYAVVIIPNIATWKIGVWHSNYFYTVTYLYLKPIFLNQKKQVYQERNVTKYIIWFFSFLKYFVIMYIMILRRNSIMILSKTWWQRVAIKQAIGHNRKYTKA